MDEQLLSKDFTMIVAIGSWFIRDHIRSSFLAKEIRWFGRYRLPIGCHTDYEQAQEDLEMKISHPNGTNLSPPPDGTGYATPTAAQIAAHFLDITLLAAGRPVIVVQEVSDGVTVVGVASPAVEYRPFDLEPLSDARAKQPPRLLE
jgi:hypothetical protein